MNLQVLLMLAKFVLVRPVPPIFKLFQLQVVPRMKKYRSNLKKILRYTRKFFFIFSDSRVPKMMYISKDFSCRVRMMQMRFLFYDSVYFSEKVRCCYSFVFNITSWKFYQATINKTTKLLRKFGNFWVEMFNFSFFNFFSYFMLIFSPCTMFFNKIAQFFLTCFAKSSRVSNGRF